MYSGMQSNQTLVRTFYLATLASMFIKKILLACLLFIFSLFSTYSLANSAPSNKTAIELTSEEIEWISKHPSFEVSAFSLAPYIMKKDGKVIGYVPELLRMVGAKVNLTPQFSYHEIANEAFNAVQTGKVEASMASINTPERAQHLTFSTNTIPLNLAIFARKNSKSISSLESLKNSRIASYHGYTLLSLTKKQLPEAELILANDAVGMLQLVATGKADAAIQELHTGQYMLHNNYINNLEVKGYATFKGLEVAQGHSYVVNKAYPLLQSILDKGYKALTEKEKQEIWNKWFGKAISKTPEIHLSANEKAWLAAHPMIRIGVDANYAPYSFRDDNGNYHGIAMEFSDYISKQLGISMKVVPDLSWPEIVDGVRERKLDVVTTFAQRPEREAFVNFTNIYLPTPLVIMRRSGETSISSEADLEGRTVAMVEGYSSSARILEEHPGVKPLKVKTTQDGLFAVSTGKADAYVGVLGINLHLLKKLGITNLEVASLYGSGKNGQRFGVRKDWPELATILDKALKAIPEGEKSRIFENWLPSPAAQLALTRKAEPVVKLSFTKEEKTWLTENPVIRLGNSVDWPPFGFINQEGNYSGIAAEYMRMIESMLGITIEPAKLGSWQESVDAARKGEVDLLDAVVPTPQRREFLTFSKPYISYPVVVFAHKDIDYIADMSVLNGQYVTVIEGSGLHDILKNNHPEFKILAKENARAGLLAVERGKASAFIGNLPTASRVISREGITNLKVAGETPYRYDLAIGINKNKPILARVIQKALDSIPEEKHNDVYRKWMSVTFEHSIDYGLLVKIFFLSFIIFIFIFVWNRQHQIKKLRREVETRKNVEDSLRKSEQYNRMLFEESPIGLALCKMNGELIDVNPAYAEIIGRTEEEAKALNYWEITPEKYAQLEQEQRSELEKTGHYGPYEKEYIHADGHLIPVRLSGQLINKGGEKFIWSSIEDITESKRVTEEKEQLQRELQQAQKMEALGNLTGGIAHEYNNMLGIILGFSELLESALAEQPKLAKYVNDIMHAGKRAALLTNKLLTFSRQKIPEAKAVNLNELLQKQQHMLEKTLTVRIKLVLNQQENLWQVWLNQGDMEDAIINMSINAMHAIKDSGQLTIQTSNQEINQLDAKLLGIDPGEYVLLSFTDTGHGIEKEIQEKIFDPFFTTKGMQGTGLGLSMVYGFVKNSKGTIQLHSEPGQGSQFTLYFPRYYGNTDEQQSIEDLSTEGIKGDQSILVVDDESSLLNLTYEILSSHGYNVFCAESANKALKILEQVPIDILISDIIMPEMDGYQLAAIVKKKYPAIKIQLVSGFDDEHHRDMVDEDIHQGLIKKPFSASKLLKRIRELLD